MEFKNKVHLTRTVLVDGEEFISKVDLIDYLERCKPMMGIENIDLIIKRLKEPVDK